MSKQNFFKERRKLFEVSTELNQKATHVKWTAWTAVRDRSRHDAITKKQQEIICICPTREYS